MSEIETGRPICVRCQEPIFNAFRKREYCLDCEIILDGMSFTGTEVLEMVLAMMPPMPPNIPKGVIPGVPIATVLQVAARVMMQKGIFPQPETDKDEGSGPSKPPLIGV